MSHCRFAIATLLLVAVSTPVFAQGRGRVNAAPVDLGTPLANDKLKLTYDPRGITSLASPSDPFNASLMRGQRLGLYARYKQGDGQLTELATNAQFSNNDNTLTYTTPADAPVQITQTFKLDGAALDWTINIQNGANALNLEDLAIVIPWSRPGGDPKAIFEQGFIKHQFIDGAGSFLYFVRPNGVGPYLLATVKTGTKLEFSGNVGAGASGRGARGGAAAGNAAGGVSGFAAFIHANASGNAEQRGTWRQPLTALHLEPNQKISYGMRLQWLPTYQAMRDALYSDGLLDIRVVPGMTMPTDLSSKIAIRTKAKLEAVTPEFPDKTTISPLAAPASAPEGTHLYEVQFKKLGENLLTITHDGGQKTYLEFFCTEPLETVIKKRSAFIAFHQQWRDPSKWYDGLFSVYDMQNKKLRSPDDTDGWVGRNEYILASDDPALCKAPYVAAKNEHFPDAKEIEAVEYYLQHYVWGGLQRTDKETPYPYGIYGIPNWHVQRDPELKRNFEANANNRPDLVEKLRTFRSYDYPHIVMLYWHMYQIASKYPNLVHYLDAKGYLERAYQTARAYFVYPIDLLPGYYETYKWGCYNELLIPDLIETLEQHNQKEKADFLRSEWEKKVKYFVYDDPYPFRSEYAFDRTAFESSYALAKYGAITPMKADEKLWRDPKVWFDSKGAEEKWYSHPSVKPQDSLDFMKRQHLAGLAVRGTLENAFYLLGADATGGTGSMSYMAQMGGWSVLDYGLNFDPQPADSLELGYASYLSAWSLVNTGTPETNYGFWFPGKENDGATGWTFSNARWGRGWYAKEDPRGPWHYDGEIDLGYGAGLRMACTLFTIDPTFGPLAYGASLSSAVGTPATYSITPRDGLRQRFNAVIGNAPNIQRLKLELTRDGFAAEQPITVDANLQHMEFTLENRTNDSHDVDLRLSSPNGLPWSVSVDGKPVNATTTTNWDYPITYRLHISGPSAKMELVSQSRQ